MFKRVFVAVLLALFATSVQSEERRLALGGWSSHWCESCMITNKDHKIVAAEYKSWTAGYYENSYGRDTFFVARVGRIAVSENVNLVGSVGLSRGYRGCLSIDDGAPGKDASVCLQAYAGIEYDKYRFVPTLKFIPFAVIFSPEIKF
jgi:hypothetical protein